jgi:hypothetical protein
MLSTWVVGDPPPLLLLVLPPQPAMPAAIPAIAKTHANAYTRRLRAGTPVRLKLRISSIARTLLPNVKGATGTSGLRLDGLPTDGGALESAVISIAEQVAGAVDVPAVAVQATGEPSAVVPLMNWTVPVTPGPLFVELLTFAVKVTLLPEFTVVALVVSAVVVATVPVETTVIDPEPEPDA